MTAVASLMVVLDALVVATALSTIRVHPDNVSTFRGDSIRGWMVRLAGVGPASILAAGEDVNPQVWMRRSRSSGSRPSQWRRSRRNRAGQLLDCSCARCTIKRMLRSRTANAAAAKGGSQ